LLSISQYVLQFLADFNVYSTVKIDIITILTEQPACRNVANLPVTQHNGIRQKHVSISFLLLENAIVCPNDVQYPST